MPTVRINGLREVRSALRKIGQGLPAALRDAQRAAAQIVVDRALPNVPVRTGRLKGSVRALGSQASGRAVAGNGRVPYAAAIHWGRKRSGAFPGRPFLWNAAEEARDDVVRHFEDALDDLINGAT